MKTPDASHVRHIDKSISIPTGVADFKEWSQTVIVMDKYADMNRSFAELIAVAEKDPKAMRYVTWLIGTSWRRSSRGPQGLCTRHCDEWVGADLLRRSEFINFVPPNPDVSLDQPSDSLLLRYCTWTCRPHVDSRNAKW